MKIFSFGKEVSRPMSRYQSISISYSQITEIANPSKIGCMYIEPKGIAGIHQAPSPQLFLVVQGEGWISREDESRIPVTAGQGVFWERGEMHESGSDTGMTIIIVQCDEL
ncbi:MAG TPA: cupin domain-containing protein [Candidatus Deferrimicrobium sp.]|nr:cupin domain-containing protein [Candidatus Deferrimicrobium sp.]